MSTIATNVARWYADTLRWVPQGKTDAWPDRVLLEDDHEATATILDGREVLNVGCFYPEDEKALAWRAKTWTAMDFVPEVIQRCQSMALNDSDLGMVGWYVGNMTALPFLDGQFDVVTDFSAGDHLSLDDFQTFLREAHRVLRPAGDLVVIFANRDAHEAILGQPERERHGDYGYERRDTHPEMQAMLMLAGFEVVRVTHEAGLRTGVLARRTP